MGEWLILATKQKVLFVLVKGKRFIQSEEKLEY